MKATIKIFALFLVLNSFTWIAPQKASAQVSVSFQIFYDDLSPYGDWVDNSDYGYVWVPNVSSGFTPYSTNGYWIFTDEGWTWVSNYSWGWAPFHYGRWFYDRNYGWLWAPDNEWGPGWVTWRRSEGYYGWAPIGPGISIDIAYSNGYNLPYNQWTFVRDRDFGRSNINNYYINSSNNVTIINNSTIINNIQANRSNNVRYNAGPDRTDVERRAGKRFTPVAIRESSNRSERMNNGELQLYRPRVEKNNTASQKPAPSKVMNLRDVKAVGQRNNENQPQKENQPNKGLPVERQRNDQPIKEQPIERKRNDQPIKEQPIERKRNDQPVKEQPIERKRNDQPVKEQPVERKRNDQPVKEQPVERKRNDQPVKEQPVERKRNDQPVKEQPIERKRNDQPVKQQPVERKQNDQPVKQKPTQPQKTNPPKKVNG